MHQDPKSALPDIPGANREDDRWKLVENILASRTFAKATRLSSFLSYICQLTLEGRADEINEQQIGIHVFSRSPSYNPTDDSIVRTHARLLRQRLYEYFEHECPGSQLIIQVPKGGYVPIFQRNTNTLVEPPLGVAVASFPSAPDTTSMRAAPNASGAPWFWVTAIALILLLLGLDIALRTNQPRSPEAQRRIWASIFNRDRSTVIVCSDDALVLFQEMTRSPVSLDDYLSGSYLETTPQPNGQIPISASWLNSHRYTSMADLVLAMRLGRIPEALGVPIETRFARDLRIDDLKNKNVILIGGIGANPWAGLFANQLNFSVNYDWKGSRGYVLNKMPKHGEPALYQETKTDGVQRNFGVLAYLKGIEGTNEVLLFEGTGMAGTQSAADFLMNRTAFSSFVQQIGGTKYKVPHFEILLETTSIGGNAPQAKVLAYRLLG